MASAMTKFKREWEFSALTRATLPRPPRCGSWSRAASKTICSSCSYLPPLSHWSSASSTMASRTAGSRAPPSFSLCSSSPLSQSVITMPKKSNSRSCNKAKELTRRWSSWEITELWRRYPARISSWATSSKWLRAWRSRQIPSSSRVMEWLAMSPHWRAKPRNLRRRSSLRKTIT